jgi:hypothetical protein
MTKDAYKACPISARELLQYIINDGPGYTARCEAARMSRHNAAAMFTALARAGAERYEKEFGVKGEQVFNVATMLLVGADLAEYYTRHIVELDEHQSTVA